MDSPADLPSSPPSQTLFADFVILTNLIIGWKSVTVLTDLILTFVHAGLW